MAARKLMVDQPNRHEEGQTCAYNVSPFYHPIDPIDLHRSERISALGASRMSAPELEAQEKLLRRSKKQAREQSDSNALIQAAGTGEWSDICKANCSPNVRQVRERQK